MDEKTYEQKLKDAGYENKEAYDREQAEERDRLKADFEKGIEKIEATKKTWKWLEYYNKTKAALDKINKEVELLDKDKDQDRIKVLNERFNELDSEAAYAFESYRDAKVSQKQELKDLLFGLEIGLGNLTRVDYSGVITIPTRGGAREGAGRKPIPEKEKKQPVSVSLSPQAVETLKILQEKSNFKNPSAVIEHLLIDNKKGVVMHKHIQAYFDRAEKRGFTPIGIDGCEEILEFYRADKLIGIPHLPHQDFSDAPFWVGFSYGVLNMHFIPVHSSQEFQILIAKFLEMVGGDDLLDVDGEERFNEIVNELKYWWQLPFTVGKDKIKDPSIYDEDE